MRAKRERKEKSKWGMKLVIVAIFIIVIGIILNLAPNYIRKKTTGKIEVIINNNDVTDSMKLDAYVDENEVVYLSTKDIGNFFDEDIFYDNQYDQIITTSSTKLAVLPIEKKEMYVNSSKVKIYGAATKKEGEFYVPFSELKDVYNVEVNYKKESNILTIDSIDKEQTKANASKDIAIKYKPTIFSKTVDKVKKGDSIIVIEEAKNGWNKVRTTLGKIGYTKDITNLYKVRENMEPVKPIEGKVSLVWDYYTSVVPDRTGTKINGINVVSPSFAELVNLGKGELNVKIGQKGEEYIKWAHNNGYQVWAIVSNSCSPDIQDTTTEILNDYQLREKLINNIIDLVLKYQLDGINIDFEYIKVSNKNMFSQFIIELAPRLREYGKVLSVDVTAPDGSEDWSECYNRNKLGKVADYLIFMAYDQYGTSSTQAGTTAGADWIETNLKKFIEREEVEESKIILGMPFYTRLWEENGNKLDSKVIWMKNIEANIPAGVEKVWNENTKQYYIEYQQNNKTYKMWIEDEASIKEKFALMKQYHLAGAAYWQKDFETNSLWQTIQQELQ